MLRETWCSDRMTVVPKVMGRVTALLDSGGGGIRYARNFPYHSTKDPLRN